MDVIQNFLDKYAYRFPKGYPDLTQNEDKLLLEIILKENGIDINEVEEEPKGDYGYHAGDLKHKSGLLSRNNFMRTLKSQLGTGYFFFGDIEDAAELAGIKKGDKAREELLKDTSIHKADFSKYKLFKPTNATQYYQSLITPMMSAINSMTLEDVTAESTDDLIDIADYYRELGVNISDDDFMSIIKQYLTDMDAKSSTSDDNLNTRIMKHVGFEGIDLRHTEKDGVSDGKANVGSVLFDLKSGTVDLNEIKVHNPRLSFPIKITNLRDYNTAIEKLSELGWSFGWRGNNRSETLQMDKHNPGEWEHLKQTLNIKPIYLSPFDKEELEYKNLSWSDIPWDLNKPNPINEIKVHDPTKLKFPIEVKREDWDKKIEKINKLGWNFSGSNFPSNLQDVVYLTPFSVESFNKKELSWSSKPDWNYKEIETDG